MPYGFTIICPPLPPAPPPPFTLVPAAGVPDLSWQGIAYSPTLGAGLGRLVCVGQSGGGTRAMSSDDAGQNWTLRVTTNTVFEKVAWSPALGLFAACSRTLLGNRIETSPDGIVWTPRVTPVLDYFDIAWNPSIGLFAAVGGVVGGPALDHIITSPDGINWTQRAAPALNFWSAIGVGLIGGVSGFIAVAGNLSGALNRIMTSTDGITWLAGVNPITLNFAGVDYSPTLGLWAATGGLLIGTQIITSPDGIAWTVRASPTVPVTLGPQRIKWAPTIAEFIVCVGINNTVFTGIRFWRSLDGITWAAFTSPADTGWKDIVDTGPPANKLIILSFLIPHFAISPP